VTGSKCRGQVLNFEQNGEANLFKIQDLTPCSCKLAAGGYITPEEYKAKKQAIIDAM